VIFFPFSNFLLHGKFDNLPLRAAIRPGNPFCPAKRIWLKKFCEIFSLADAIFLKHHRHSHFLKQ